MQSTLLESANKLKCPNGVQFILQEKLQREAQLRIVAEPPRIVFKPLRSFFSSREPTIISSLAFNSRGTNFAAGGINKKIKLYDWASCLSINHAILPKEIENCSKVIAVHLLSTEIILFCS